MSDEAGAIRVHPYRQWSFWCASAIHFGPGSGGPPSVPPAVWAPVPKTAGGQPGSFSLSLSPFTTIDRSSMRAEPTSQLVSVNLSVFLNIGFQKTLPGQLGKVPLVGEVASDVAPSTVPVHRTTGWNVAPGSPASMRLALPRSALFQPFSQAMDEPFTSSPRDILPPAALNLGFGSLLPRCRAPVLLPSSDMAFCFPSFAGMKGSVSLQGRVPSSHRNDYQLLPNFCFALLQSFYLSISIFMSLSSSYCFRFLVFLPHKIFSGWPRLIFILSHHQALSNKHATVPS